MTYNYQKSKKYGFQRRPLLIDVIVVVFMFFIDLIVRLFDSLKQYKKRRNGVVISILFLFGLMLSGGSVRASVIVSQSVYDSNVSELSGGGYVQALGTGLPVVSITDVDVRASGPRYSVLDVGIIETTSSVTSTVMLSGQYIVSYHRVIDSTSTVFYNLNGADVYVSTSSIAFNDPTKYYWLFVGDISTPLGQVYGSSSTYGGNVCFNTQNGGGCGLGSLFFSINGGNSVSATISIVYPGDNSSLSGDFSDWNVLINSGSGFSGTLGVQYGVAPSYADYFDTELAGQSYVGGVSSTVYLPKVDGAALQGNYRARPCIFDVDGNVDFCGDIIDFSVSGLYTHWSGDPASPYNPNPRLHFPEEMTTSTDNVASLFYKDCSTAGQWTDTYTGINIPFFASSSANLAGCLAQKYILAIIKVLIVPPDFSMDFLKDGFLGLKSVFPFQFFFGTSDVIGSNLPTSTAAVTGVNLTVHFGNTTSTSEDSVVNVRSSSTLETFLGPVVLGYWYDFVLFAAGVGYVILLIKLALIL